MLEAIFPRGEPQAELCLEAGRIQSRVCRPWRRERIGAGRYGSNRLGLNLEGLTRRKRRPDNGLGIGMPGGDAIRNQVIQAEGESRPPLPSRRLVAQDGMGSHIRQQRGRCRGTGLVRHDLEHITLGCKAQDGFGKVTAVGAKDPAGPKNQAIGPTRLHRLFSVEFGFSVDALRVGYIVLCVGTGLGAVEDVIGGVVNNQGAEPFCFFTQDAGGHTINGLSKLRFGFGLVYSGISRRIDDDGRGHIAHQLANGIGVGEIAFSLIDRDNFTQYRERALQFKANLAVFACEENAGRSHGWMKC